MIRFAFSKHHSNTQGEYLRKRHDWRERGSERERERENERESASTCDREPVRERKQATTALRVIT